MDWETGKSAAEMTVLGDGSNAGRVVVLTGESGVGP